MGKSRILIIEDDEYVRTLLERILSSQGYKIRSAANGRIGVELFRQEPSDIVITDMVMPEMEGVETIINIRSDFPKTKIIAISGGSLSLPADTCLTIGSLAGATVILRKPFRKTEILDKIRELES